LNILKLLLKHIDLINCIIIWIILVTLMLNLHTLGTFTAFYVWVGWIPFIFGFMRLRYFRKSVMEAILFILNVISLPVYLFLIFASYMTLHG